MGRLGATSWSQMQRERFTTDWVKQRMLRIFDDENEYKKLGEYERAFVAKMCAHFKEVSSSPPISAKQWAFAGTLARRVDDESKQRKEKGEL